MNKIMYCPICHQRLFDADPRTRGSVEIKCPRCKQVQHIQLYGKTEKKETSYLATE